MTFNPSTNQNLAQIMMITHLDNTGVRISNKPYTDDPIMDIIVTEIKKYEHVKFLVIPHNKQEQEIILPIKFSELAHRDHMKSTMGAIYYDHAVDHIIERKDNQKYFFGIAKKQNADWREEIRIAYHFPFKYLQKGYFNSRVFRPYFENNFPVQKKAPIPGRIIRR